jgi:uncharacterized protein YdaL
MYRWRTVSIIVAAVTMVCLLASVSLAQAASDHKLKKVLVVYDRRNIFGFLCDEVTAVVHLFYHFQVAVDEVALAFYEKGMLSHYDCVVYIGIEERDLNEDLLADLLDYERPILFIGRGIEYLIDRKYSYEVAYQGEIYRPAKVVYRGREFALSTSRAVQKIHITGPEVNVISLLGDGREWYPYVLTTANLWYVSCFSTDEKALFYILADILHDFFAEEHTKQPEVYVRIEDVHCLRSTESLYKIADYLADQDIPFMVALIPAYYDSERDYIHHLGEHKSFARAVKYMQDGGGSILLHGYTHQIHRSMPGEGFEFWDGKKDCPLDVDMERWVDERINSGIDECVAAGIFPLGFEAPHYAVSQPGYVQLKKYFSTVVGHLQTSDKGFTTTIYPYRLYNSPLYNQLLPENLGYVDPDNPLSAQQILEELDKVSIVRDFTAGFFFHPYLDIDWLQAIIEQLKQHNVQFVDLKAEDNWVEGTNHTIWSLNGSIEVEVKKQEEPSPVIALVMKVVTLLALVVTLICLRLFIIFLQARRQSKENLFK